MQNNEVNEITIIKLLKKKAFLRKTFCDLLPSKNIS